MNYLIALSVPILWGTSYAIIGTFLTEIPSQWLAVWRALPAGILLFLLRPKLMVLPWRQMLLISLGNITLFFPLLMTAIYLLPGSVAGTLGATFPLIMMLFNWLIFNVKPKMTMLICAAIGIFGVSLLLNPSVDVNLYGVYSAFAAISVMSLTSIWIKKINITDIINVSAWQLILGGLLLIPFAWLTAGPFQLPTSHAAPGLIWLICLNTAYGYWAWVRSVKQLGTELMGLFSLLNPMTAVALGVFLMGEVLDSLQQLGILLVLIALIAPTIKLRGLRVNSITLKSFKFRNKKTERTDS